MDRGVSILPLINDFGLNMGLHFLKIGINKGVHILSKIGINFGKHCRIIFVSLLMANFDSK